MGIQELLRWQWQGYEHFHRSRLNLWLHLLLVPLFLVSNVVLVLALVRQAWMAGGIALLAMVLSIALQGRGHRQEAVPPEPFSGPANALLRIFLEQWITFPRFIFSGGWFRNVRGVTVEESP